MCGYSAALYSLIDDGIKGLRKRSFLHLGNHCLMQRVGGFVHDGGRFDQSPPLPTTSMESRGHPQTELALFISLLLSRSEHPPPQQATASQSICSVRTTLLKRRVYGREISGLFKITKIFAIGHIQSENVMLSSCSVMHLQPSKKYCICDRHGQGFY